MDAENSLNESGGIRRRSARRRSVSQSWTLNSADFEGASSIKKEGEESDDEEVDPGKAQEERNDEAEETWPRRGRKRKMKRSSALVKRSRISKNRVILRQYNDTESFSSGSRVRMKRQVFEEPLRRSKREKRLMFATFNVSKMDKQILNPGHDFPDIESEDEMDPYEKFLSPRRTTRRSARLRRGDPSLSVASTAAQGSELQDVDDDGKADVKDKDKEETGVEGREEEEEEEESDDQSEEEEEEEGDEGEGGYYLRKRQPVIYHFQPVHQVVEDVTPPKKRRGQRGQDHASYHSKSRSAAPRAYQTRRGEHIIGKAPRKRHAHHDSSSTSSDTDSDEARFRHRKARSMAKARTRCLPMNFTPDDVAQGVMQDRSRIGSSLADINPMNIDRSVTFDSIGGLKQHIRALKEMIIFPLLYPEVFEHFQINPPRGVLFYGPPGCGKTLVARALANECSKGGKKVAFFMRKGADCLSKWVGESERQLRLLFDQAYQVRPSIIFFDEIDGLAPVRSSRQDQIHSSIVSTLLALMDGLDSRGEIVVIGATNRIDAIDPALRRPGRFDREFVFSLPSRDDRQSILSIHTKAWNPKIKDEFLSELAENTVNYCGADLRAVCTEAALFALRRKYPQIYNTTEKLVLDTTQISVSASDFHDAVKAIVPTAQRSDDAIALSLPESVRPLYLQSLKSLLSLVSFLFPHSWKLVSKVSSVLEILLAREKGVLEKIQEKLDELRGGSGFSFSMQSSETKSSSTDDITAVNHIKRGSRLAEASVKRSHLKSTASLKAKRRSSASKSPSGGEFASPSSTHTVPNASRGGAYAGGSSGSGDPSPLAGAALNLSLNKTRQKGEKIACSPYSQLFMKQTQSVDLKDVFFDLSEMSYENPSEHHQASILAVDQEPSKKEDCLSEKYTSFSSHPHLPPSVHHPRLVLCGREGMGQSSYLGPALLHALEDLPVKTMDLSTIFGSSSRTPEEACTQILRELKRVTPSILYLPRLDSWWDVTSETFQVTLLSSLSSLPPSVPLLVLATAECPWSELPAKLKAVFMDSGGQFFSSTSPSDNQRKQFFYEVLLNKPFFPPPPRPKLLSEISLEDLPVASPPKPRELSTDEIARVTKQREAVLRELRVFLRDATNKLLAERKFKEFVKSVNPEEVPDYYDIIVEPMDLSTIMKKIDEHRYTVPKQWIADVNLIAKNALEYNPEHDSESRLLRHRAVALQDTAHSILDHELSEDFEKQCEEISQTFKRLGGPNQDPCMERDKDSTPCSSNLDYGLYEDVPRRSLRQKGLGPEGRGFPYYSPSKMRSPWKNADQAAEEEGSAVGQSSRHDGSVVDQSSRHEDSEVAQFTRHDDDDSVVGQSAKHNGDDASISDSEGEAGKIRSEPISVSECPVVQNGLDTAERNGSYKFTNANVCRQIIRPWENDNKSIIDTAFGSSDKRTTRNSLLKQHSDSGHRDELQSVEESVDSGLSMSVETSQGSDSVQTAVEALMSMGTPKKSSRSSSEMSLSENGSERNQVDVDGGIVAQATKTAAVCNSATAQHQERVVSVDGRGLVELFERIVKGTEVCSVKEMERIHALYEQLVFRHRMSWEREGLLEDLRLATNLFMQELHRS